MDSLPSGTVTLVFSDIEGSTLLLSRLGDAYRDALDGQRSVLRSAWSQWGGRELGTEGDSFFVVFAAVGDAANATLQAQREMAGRSWPDGESVRVRIGMHTGEPVIHDGGYVGMDVHRAARVASAAHGGQIVLTDSSCRVLQDKVPSGARLLDLGLHRLKDLSQPEHLFELSDQPGQTFPPVKSLGNATSLPVERTPLLGRRGELDELSGLMTTGGVRLLTLTGPGGSGKTRLATALAAELAGEFADGVFFVALADVATGSGMWAAIPAALGLTGDAAERPRIMDHLRSRNLLLVLDNLEQLVDAPQVVNELLEAATDLVVVATSRRPLHLRGEHEHAIPPLELPVGDELADIETASAVQLFCQHARMVRAGFRLTSDNARSVVAICRRLDGLPLAIELAAARSKLLSPAGLLSRLDQTTGLSTTDADRPVRQQALHSTISWSYDLLPPNLQGFFCRLGVFAGGCDLDAVAAVADSSGDPLDNVAELVDVSLAAVVDGPDGEPRISLLQTIADFAIDRLSAQGELPHVRQRHAEHYLGLAESLAPQLNTGRQLAAAARLHLESANLRSALTWSLRPGAVEFPEPDAARLGLRLAAVLSDFGVLRVADTESRHYLERALAVDRGADSPERATVLIGLAAGLDEHLDTPSELLQRALEISRRLDDASGMSQALTDLANWHLRRGDLVAARELLQQSADLSHRARDSVRLALALHVLGEAELEFGDANQAIELLEQSRSLGLERGDESWVVWEEHWISIALVRCGRVGEAAERMRTVVAKVLRLSDSLLDNRPGYSRGGFRGPWASGLGSSASRLPGVVGTRPAE
jgi:predicted ATPase/class 3 adenylate cyclase